MCFDAECDACDDGIIVPNDNDPCCGDCISSTCTTSSGMSVEDGAAVTIGCSKLFCKAGVLVNQTRTCREPRECPAGKEPTVTDNDGCCDLYGCVDIPDSCEPCDCDPGFHSTPLIDGDACCTCEADGCMLDGGIELQSGENYTDPSFPCAKFACRTGKLEKYVTECREPAPCRDNEVLKKKETGGCCPLYFCEAEPSACEGSDTACVACGEDEEPVPAEDGACCGGCRGTSCTTPSGQVIKNGESAKEKCQSLICVGGSLSATQTPCTTQHALVCPEGEQLVKTVEDDACCPTVACEPISSTCATKSCDACSDGTHKGAVPEGECCAVCEEDSCLTEGGVPLEAGQSIRTDGGCTTLACAAGKITETKVTCAGPPMCADGQLIKEDNAIEGVCCRLFSCFTPTSNDPCFAESQSCTACAADETEEYTQGQCCPTCRKTSCVAPDGTTIADGGTLKQVCSTYACESGRISATETSCGAPPTCEQDQDTVKTTAEGQCCASYSCRDKPASCDPCASCPELQHRGPVTGQECCGACQPNDCTLEDGTVVKNDDESPFMDGSTAVYCIDSVVQYRIDLEEKIRFDTSGLVSDNKPAEIAAVIKLDLVRNNFDIDLVHEMNVFADSRRRRGAADVESFTLAIKLQGRKRDALEQFASNFSEALDDGTFDWEDSVAAPACDAACRDQVEADTEQEAVGNACPEANADPAGVASWCQSVAPDDQCYQECVAFVNADGEAAASRSTPGSTVKKHFVLLDNTLLTETMSAIADAVKADLQSVGPASGMELISAAPVGGAKYALYFGVSDASSEAEFVGNLNAGRYSIMSRVPSPPQRSTADENDNAGMIAGIVVGVLVAIILVVALIVMNQRNKSGGYEASKDTTAMYTNPVYETHTSGSGMKRTPTQNWRDDEAAQGY
jgi:hypothetical protein